VRLPTQLKTVKLLPVLAMLCVLGSLTACGTRTVIVQKGDPLQIREPIKTKVWVFDKDGNRVESEAVLPAGWYAIDGPDEKKSE
jgi:hypothetical protein